MKVAESKIQCCYRFCYSIYCSKYIKNSFQVSGQRKDYSRKGWSKLVNQIQYCEISPLYHIPKLIWHRINRLLIIAKPMDFVLRPMRNHHRGMTWWFWWCWDHLLGNGSRRLRGVNLGTGQSSIQPWESECRLGNKDKKRGDGFEKLVNDSAFSGSVPEMPETGFRTIFELQWPMHNLLLVIRERTHAAGYWAVKFTSWEMVTRGPEEDSLEACPVVSPHL